VGDIRIRDLTSYEEFEKVVHIQKIVWKHKNVDLTPAHQFTISIKTGAILLGAFVRDELVGFVYSFPAVVYGNLAQHSHQLAVLPRFRGKNIGKMLKWSQRRKALKMGYEILTWTSDPLLARNANMNLHTLGAEVRTYLQDFYTGIPALSVGRGIPVDRFLMEWHINKKKVDKRRRRGFDKIKEEAFPLVLDGAWRHECFLQKNPRLGLEGGHLLAEIPRNIPDTSKTTEEIMEWQKAVRRVMKHYFAKGYRAVDFIYKERCYYVL